MRSSITCLLCSVAVLAIIAAPTCSDEPAVLKVSFQDLARAYAENAALADQKYLDHEVEVTGILAQVSTVFGQGKGTRTQFYVVRMNTHQGKTGEIRAFLSALFDAAERAELAKLRVNSEVTIKGKCIAPTYHQDAAWNMVSINLVQCKIVTKPAVSTGK